MRWLFALALPLFAPRTAPPLPMLPSIPRVRIEVLKNQVVVIQELNFPRGEWTGDSLDLYVAFGAPGAPRAIDAHLLPVADGALEPEDDALGEALATERVARRPPTAHPLLGRDVMAGLVIRVKRESFARALAPGNMAALRIRTVLDLPDEDPSGARGVVVRLGASRGTPLTLGRLVLESKAGAAVATRATANLCGTDADPRPLAIALHPRAPSSPSTPSAAAIAPVLSVRHATDDLCIRFWASP